jgi:hypothetical protein
MSAPFQKKFVRSLKKFIPLAGSLCSLIAHPGSPKTRSLLGSRHDAV